MARKYSTPAPITPAELDGMPGFDEFTLDAFARGWNYASMIAGNPRAPYAPPIPGAMADYCKGMDAAEHAYGLDYDELV